MSSTPTNQDSYTFDRFLNARRCYGPSFSPDSTHVAFLSDISGIPQAWLLPAKGGWPEQITFHDDRVGLAAFSPRSDRLIIGTDVGGDENVQLWLLDLRTAMLHPLTGRPEAMHPFGGWSPDARLIAYTSNERDRACLDVVVQDVETGEARTILQTHGMCAVEGWSPDGRRLVLSQIDSSSNNDLLEVQVDTGEAR